LIILLNSNSFVSAAPQIDFFEGVFIHGNSISISGSGFGFKADSPPELWDNFDDYDGVVENDKLGSEGFWSVDLNGDRELWEEPYFDADPLRVRHSNTGFNARYPHVQDSAYIVYKSGLDFSSNKIYADFWMYVQTPNNAEFLTSGWQTKFFRIGASSNSGYNYPDINFKRASWDSCKSELNKGPDGMCGDRLSFWHSGCPDEGWHHYQMMLDVGDVGVDNGEIYLWIDGELRRYYEDFNVFCQEGSDPFQQANQQTNQNKTMNHQ